MKLLVLDGAFTKSGFSENYHFSFDKRNGSFARWGKTHDDDPEWSPFGPEILDLEISSGACLGKGCGGMCYKDNGHGPTKNMSLETFRKILSVLPHTLMQIAIGTTNISANPEFWDIIKEGKKRGLAMNFTTHGLDVDDEVAKLTSEFCGAVAVSIVDREKSYAAIRRFLDAGCKQVNIHYVVSEEREEDAKRVIYDVAQNPDLRGVNAIVFLQYKPKGRGTRLFSPLQVPGFRRLVAMCEENGVAYGFDSCSAPAYLRVIEGRSDEEQLRRCVEPCESGLFSSYISVDGMFYACSFCENRGMWQEGINVLEFEGPQDFLDKLWRSEKLNTWRKSLLQCGRSCPVYDLPGGE
jgi:hypothetical protein